MSPNYVYHQFYHKRTLIVGSLAEGLVYFIDEGAVWTGNSYEVLSHFCLHPELEIMDRKLTYTILTQEATFHKLQISNYDPTYILKFENIFLQYTAKRYLSIIHSSKLIH